MSMSVEALSILLCAAKLAFAHGDVWTQAQCRERAEQVLTAAQAHDVSPLAMISIDAQECDWRDGITRPIYAPADINKPRAKRRIIGHDLCPMGLRIYEPIIDRAKWTNAVIFDRAATKMARLKRWCDHAHDGHFYLGHWNPGNPTYAESILGILFALQGKASPTTDPRTKEIVMRLGCVWRKVHGQKERAGTTCPWRMMERLAAQ